MRTLVFRTVFLTALTVGTSAAQQSDTAFTWSRELSTDSRFSIRNLNGMIEVRPGTTDRVELHATIRVGARARLSDVTFEVRDANPKDIEICTVYKGISACEPDNMWGDDRAHVTYVISMPKGLRLRASTGNGDVLVLQSVAEADVSSGNGDVVIRESSSRASASTGNGDVTVAAANGPVKVSTGNGRITINTSIGPVDATTGNGDIDARMTSIPQGRDVPSMSLSSGNGTIRLALPPDFNGELDAITGSGSINTDFEVRVQGRLERSRLRGTIGTGVGPVIKIRSGSGRLEIRKD